MKCIRGQKIKLRELTSSQQLRVDITLEWSGGDDLDIACFGLDASGKLADDRYFIFFNQPESPEGALRGTLSGRGTARFDIDLHRLPPSVRRLTFTAAIDGASTLAAMGEGVLRLRQGNEELLTFPFSGADFSSEKAVMLFDIYFKDEWRVAAVGQGFNAGLKALLEHFGGEALEVPPPPAPTVSLRKITLEKRGDSQKVDLGKKNAPQTIHINLNWDQGAKKARLFGRKTTSADLDLGCMYEMLDGEKGVIQALGGNFGDRNGSPWILLDKDDRSGTAADGENLYVLRPDKVRRILVFAFIYEGAGNFTDVNGRVLLRDGAGNEITIRLDSPDARKTFCAICTLRHTGDALEVTKEERYFQHHGEADKQYGFGFRWKAGSK